MNNESVRRLMIKERERREARIKAEAEALKQAEAKTEVKEKSEEWVNIAEELQEDIEDVIADRENGDNEPDTES